MYQKPDFVKVDVDIKDNFAGYTAPCDAWETAQIYYADRAGTNCKDKAFYAGYVIEGNLPIGYNFACYDDVV